MFRNYFNTAWRNLLNHKFYSLITLAGLTLGLAIGMLILLWVQDEKSFDSFHKDVSNIYKLENQVGTGSSQQIWRATNPAIGPQGKDELPEIKTMVRTTFNSRFSLFRYKNKVLTEDSKFFVDPEFFSLFRFPLIKGDPKTVFPDDHSVVLSERMAKRYFADEDPMGKTILADDSILLKVTGIIANPPLNSSFSKYEMLYPISYLDHSMQRSNNGKGLVNDFNEYNYFTYLHLTEKADLKSLVVKLRNIHLRNKADDTDINYLLLPVTRMHLFKSDGSDAGNSTIAMFSLIALFILLIACINYVNLATARSLLRAKEVSMRKIVGAGRFQLFLQFTVETSLIFILATIMAICLIPLLLPYFNNLSGKELQFKASNPAIWLLIAATTAATLLLSSIYPAILLSSFEPLKALKGKVSLRFNDVLFRKGLVILQFAFSVMLIVGTIVIGKQLAFIHSQELGYNKDQVFSFYTGAMKDHSAAIKDALKKKPGVIDLAYSNYQNIVDLGSQTGNNDFDGKEPNSTFFINIMAIDESFIPFFKMKMVAGNNFSGAVIDSAHVILNETAVRDAGIKDPIGKRFRVWENNATIVGVVKDFHFSSIRNKISPAVFYYNPHNNNRAYIRTTGKDAKQAIAAAAAAFKQYNGDFPFSYSFLDENYNSLYLTETRTGLLFRVFAAIAMIISCLGLLGLTAYTAQVRTREIGIRKVLGASVSGIIGLLAGDFIRLVLLSILLATPLAWYLMQQWLGDFAYKTDITWTVFLLAAVLAIGIALLTIGIQSVRAALMNPVKSLRSE